MPSTYRTRTWRRRLVLVTVTAVVAFVAGALFPADLIAGWLS